MPLIAGRYRLGETLGVGGMGKVWLARDEVLERDVAIKEVLLPDDLLARDRGSAHRRTLREARAAARLGHPNVVQVYDVLDVDDRPWIVMAYIPSRSLHEVLKASGPLEPRRVARIGLDLLAALRAAHAAGVDHRDVKPANVLLADDGRVLLTDFGIATIEGDSQISSSDMLIGSPEFMSPERARTGTAGMASDLWSLGATLYAAVEGRSPFHRTSALATLTALAADEPDPPQQAGPLTAALTGLLRKDPRERITATEAEHLLREAASGAYGHALVPVRAESATTEALPATPPAAGPTPPAKPEPAADPAVDAAPVAKPDPAAAPAADAAPAAVDPASAAEPGPAGGAAPVVDPGSSVTPVPAEDPASPAVKAAPAVDPASADAASAGEVAPAVDPASAGAASAAESVPAAGAASAVDPASSAKPAPPADPSSADAAPPARPVPVGGGAPAADQASPATSVPAAGVAPAADPASGVRSVPAADRAPSARPASGEGTAPAAGAASRGKPVAAAGAGPIVEPAPTGSESPFVPAQRSPSDGGTSLPARGRATPATPDPRDQPAGSPGRRWLVVAAAVVALIGGGVFWGVTRSDSDGEPETGAQAPAASAAATPTSTQAASPSTSAPATSPAASPATSQATPSPTGDDDGGPGSGAGLPELPDGWRDYRDSTGFAVYVPEGWNRSREGSIVYFRDSRTGRILGIDQTKKPIANPVADWQGKSEYRVSRGDFPSYREIHIRETDYFRKAADWEFTFLRGGVRQHVNNRGVITSAKQAYGFYWQTRDADWQRYRDDLQLIFDSFRPAS